MDLHREQQQEVMEISSEEEEEKTETSLSSNEIRQKAKASHWIGSLLKLHKKKKSQQIAVIPLVTMKVVLPNN
jgi:hypothetical protein